VTSVTGVTGATDSPRLESYERWLGGHLSNRSTGRPTIRMDGKESRPLLKCGFEFSHSVCLRKEKRGCCCRARFYSNLAAATRAGFRLSRLALFCSPFLLLARGLPFQPRNPLFGMHCCLSSASRSITFSHIHPLSNPIFDLPKISPFCFITTITLALPFSFPLPLSLHTLYPSILLYTQHRRLPVDTCSPVCSTTKTTNTRTL